MSTMIMHISPFRRSTRSGFGRWYLHMQTRTTVAKLLITMSMISTRDAHAAPPDAPAVTQVSFNQAIEAALNRNPQVAVANESYRRAKAMVEQTRSASLPTLSAIGAYQRLSSDRIFNNAITQHVNQLSGQINLNVPLIAPQPWANWSRAKDNAKVAKVDVSNTRRQIAIVAAAAYLNIVLQKQILEVVIRARDTALAHYEFTMSQLNAGISNRLETVRASKELADDEGRVANVRTILKQARETLGVLMAINGPVDVVDDTIALPLPGYASALDEVKRRRADVQVLTQRETAARRSVDLNWTDYVPWISGVFQPFLQDPPTSTIPKNGWQAQLILTIPFYDGGLRYGQEHERGSTLEIARLNVDDLLRQAKADVRVSFEALLNADEALASARRASKFGAEALQLAVLAYHGGAATDIEVIDAVRQSRDADTQVVIAENAAQQSRVDVLAASGWFP